MIQIFEKSPNVWHFRIIDSEGEPIATSAKAYRDRDAVLTAVTDLADIVEDVSLEDESHVVVEVHEVRPGRLAAWVRDIFMDSRRVKTVQVHHPIRQNRDGQ